MKKIKPTVRLRALAIAKTQVGVKEHPPGSNSGPQVNEYLQSVGLGPNPWCLAFIHWCFLRAGCKLAGGGLVQAFEDWARANGRLVTRPFRGDVVCYDFNSDGWDEHVGIVDRVLGLRFTNGKFTGFIRTVEGNTGIGNDSNGGEVMYRYRWVNSATAFARITMP